MNKSKYYDILKLNLLMKKLKELDKNKINEYKIKVKEIHKINKKEE
ncbi:hypothetical protein AB8L61_17595 [Clostridioides difficile]